MSRANEEKKKHTGLIVFIVIIAVVILAAGGVGFGLYTSYQNSANPMDKDDDTPIAISVTEGMTTGEIADVLEENGLVSHALWFKLRSKTNGYDGAYKMGDYTFTKAMSMQEIMDLLLKGSKNTNTVTFTIPEGITTKQVMRILFEKGLTGEGEFMDEVMHGDFAYTFLEDAPEDDTRLEGFLYPDTYEIYNDASVHDIIDTMLQEFDTNFTEQDYEKAKILGYTVREAVTIASLIERETAVSTERPIIAGVINNRINKGMPLQIDASIQYLLDEPKEELWQSDLEIVSPYNTYLNTGLPPGPICSPRIESIDAALAPASHDYIYYVLAPELDGHHNFSESYEEFLVNKEAFKKAMADAP